MEKKKPSGLRFFDPTVGMLSQTECREKHGKYLWFTTISNIVRSVCRWL